MAKPASPPAMLPDAHTLPAWAEPFLTTLAETSNVTRSAKFAGTDTSAVYRLRQNNTAFRDRWFDALCEGYVALEMDLLQRLRNGALEGKTRSGRERRKYDNATSFRLLTVHREAVCKRQAQRDARDEDTVLAAIDSKLDTMRERERQARLLEQRGIADE